MATTRPARAATAPRSLMGSYRLQRAIGISAIRIALIVICVVSLFPTLYVILYSLKGGGNSLYSATLIPEKLTLLNYQNLLKSQ